MRSTPPPYYLPLTRSGRRSELILGFMSQALATSASLSLYKGKRWAGSDVPTLSLYMYDIRRMIVGLALNNCYSCSPPVTRQAPSFG